MKLELATGGEIQEKQHKCFCYITCNMFIHKQKSHTASAPSVCLAWRTISFINTDSTSVHKCQNAINIKKWTSIMKTFQVVHYTKITIVANPTATEIIDIISVSMYGDRIKP